MSENFTKSDFKTVAQLSKELNVPRETVEQTMKDIYRKGIKVIVNDVGRIERPMIYKGRQWAHKADEMRLHPLGRDKFIEILNKKRQENEI